MRKGSSEWHVLLGLIAVVALAGCESVPDTLQEPPGLLSTAAHIQDARGEPQGNELWLTFDRSVEGADGTRTDAWEVVLGPDYFAVREGDETQLFDFVFDWMIRIDHARGEFLPTSLYGLVAFRDEEVEIRSLISELYGGPEAGSDDVLDQLPIDPFWFESEFGIEVETLAGHDLVYETDGRAVVFRHAGREVARFLPSDKTVPSSMARTFARFVHHSLELHPRIASAMLEQGHFPAELTFFSHKPPVNRSTTRLSLASVETRPAAYPLPRNARGLDRFEENALFQEDAFLARLMPAMVEAVSGTYGVGVPAPEAYVAGMFHAIKGDDFLDAGLLFVELGTMHPSFFANCLEAATAEPNCRVLFAARSVSQGDERFRRLVAALDLDASGKHLEALAMAQRVNLDDTIYRDVADRMIAGFALAALRAPESGRSQSETTSLGRIAESHFERGLLGNPYIPNFYYDIGLYLSIRKQMPSAWLVFHLGRSLPTGPDRSLIDQVDQHEAELRKRHPQFF